MALANRYIFEYEKHGKNPLLEAIEREAAMLERLVVDMRLIVADVHSAPQLFHLHVIEEELLFHTNRLVIQMNQSGVNFL